MGTRRRRAGGPALALAFAVLAGCSGGADDGEDGRGSTTSGPPGDRGAPSSTAGPPVTTAATTTTTTTVPELQYAGETAAEVAAQIVAAERALRVPGAGPEELDRAGRRQQLAYRRLSSHAEEWDPVVAALIPPDVAGPFAANVAARNATRALVRSSPVPPSDTLPAWRIRAPRPVAELRAHYAEAEALSGVPWTYLAAIHLVESRMGRIVGLSSAGARGPMQFLPTTWAECCEGDIDDDRDAIVGAGRFLARRGAPQDMDAALFRYNNDRRYVAAVTAYAGNMAADERAYAGYHAWQVFYETSAGSVRLPVGYDHAEPVDAAAYVAAHPDDVER